MTLLPLAILLQDRILPWKDLSEFLPSQLQGSMEQLMRHDQLLRTDDYSSFYAQYRSLRNIYYQGSPNAMTLFKRQEIHQLSSFWKQVTVAYGLFHVL